MNNDNNKTGDKTMPTSTSLSNAKGRDNLNHLQTSLQNST